LCINKLSGAAAKSENLKELKADREKSESVFGELSEQNEKQFVISLSGNISNLFPEPELRSVFACLDPNHNL